MNPLWIAVFLWAFLGKPIAKYDNIALPILAAGTLLLVWESLTFDSALGTGLGVICGMSYAVLLILLSKEKSSFLRLKTLFIGNIITVLLASPWAFEMSSSNQINWMWVIALGCVAFGLPWIILTKVLQHISPLEFAVLSMIGPVLNSVWVFLFPPHEAPGFISCLGALVILLGIGYRVYAQSPKQSH